MGCYVAAGPKGWHLLQSLATIWQVPVSGGTEIQSAGGFASNRIEGFAVTALP
jgi:hypothetical protein